MSGIKIINVLKDDSLGEIMELFRQAPEGEVIFVLPKTSKLFSKEDHFTAFASEAMGSAKAVTLMSSNERTIELARKYRFSVMPSGKPAKTSTTAALAAAPLPGDDDAVDAVSDAFQDDVPMTSDETMGIDGNEHRGQDGDDELDGFHITDNTGEAIDEDGDGNVDRPTLDDAIVGELAVSRPSMPVAHFAMAMSKKKIAPNPIAPTSIDVPVRHQELPPQPTTPASPQEAPKTTAPEGDLDYIDAVWRDKVAQMPASTQEPQPAVDDMWAARIKRPVAAARTFWNPKMTILAVLAGALLILGGVFVMTAGEATVVVSPMAKQLQYQIPVQASETFSSVDAAFGKLPGQSIEVSKSATVTVHASGQRDVASKARGKIVIYNEYSSTPQALVATTRFMSPDGKIFRTLQNVTVPGSTVQAGKTVAGEITVDVIADKPGPDYNIGAGKFIVAAFQEKGDAEKVSKFYGVSTQAMTGGASGPSSVVTEADYAKALEQATAEVRAKMKEAFTSQGANLLVLQSDDPPLADPTSTAQPDDAAKEVSVTVTSSLKTVAFRSEDIASLIRETLAQKERQVVLPEKLEIQYKDISYKAETGILGFSIALTGNSYAPLDTTQIAKDIAGKDAEMVRSYFRGRSDVGSATVNLDPFWVTSVPSEVDRISVDLLYEPTPTP